jgi:hydroxymethylpyrimidine pyrophosphatase-like HAD family hydrolase
LAAQLGVARQDVCAVGDWYNDIPMFAWAGRSFAMGQSLRDVKKHATDELRATSDEGGGVAEAIERWLR